MASATNARIYPLGLEFSTKAGGLFGVLGILVGFAMGLAGLVLGLPTALKVAFFSGTIGFLMLVRFRGLEIHQDGTRWRKYTNIVGIRIGSWQPLDSVDRLLLKRERVSRAGGRWAITTNTVTTFELVLVGQRMDDVVLYEVAPYKKARAKAIRVAELLNKPFKDLHKEQRKAQMERRDRRW